MLDIEILNMSKKHLKEVMVVENLSFAIPWSKNTFIDELTSNHYAYYIVARTFGRVIGYAGMWKILDEGHITNIAVHPEFRGNGVGGLLLESLIDKAVEAGIIALTLEVRKSNAVAQKLYGKYGFAIEGSRKAYYANNGEDAFIMWKYITA